MELLKRFGSAVIMVTIVGLISGVGSVLTYTKWWALDPNTGTGFVMMLAFCVLVLKLTFTACVWGWRRNFLFY